MLLSECPREGDMTVFVLLGCGTPLQMTSLGRWSGLQSGRVWQRRQAREEGSGTFAPQLHLGLLLLAGTLPFSGDCWAACLSGHQHLSLSGGAQCPLLRTDTSAPGGREHKDNIQPQSPAVWLCLESELRRQRRN